MARPACPGLIDGDYELSDTFESLSVVDLPLSALIIVIVAVRNLVRNLVARTLRCPMVITESVAPIQRSGFAILVVQMLLISPLCILAGSIYWLAVVLDSR